MLIVYMKQAIAVAKENNTPFGAVLVNRKGQILAAANQTRTGDPTLHAELHLIQKAFANDTFAKTDLSLYTTGEPCPMCAGAVAWAKINRVYFGLSIAEISEFYPQINLNSAAVFEASFYKIEYQGGLLAETCRQLFKDLTK
jgi:guanine deaminase